MDLTNQVATLQDEVKLLKGEIKAVLKEIRTAVLSQDNPFSSDSGTPALQPVNRSAGDDSGEPEKKQMKTPEIPDITAVAIPTFGAQPGVAPAAGPGMVPAAGPGMPPAADPGMVPATGPGMLPVAGPGMPPAAGPSMAPSAGPGMLPVAGPGMPPAAGPGMAPTAGPGMLPVAGPGMPPADGPPSNEPIPLRPSGKETKEPSADDEPDDELDDKPDDAPAPTHEREQAWSLASIAGLAIWAEEALQALGPRRYQFVLKLAAFAELLTPEAQEVLSGMDESEPGATADERSVSVNECLVVLRQLDAIVHGERVISLPRRRGARLRRVR